MTYRKWHLAVVCICALVAVNGCGRPPAEPSATDEGQPTVAPKAKAAPKKTAAAAALSVFAGTATKPVMADLGPAYEKKTGTKVEFNYGGSGALLTTITTEKVGDVYIPGSDDFMDRAESKKNDAVLKDSRTILAYLVPAILVAKGNPKGIKTLKDLSRKGLRVVIGDTKSVCLGAIAHDVLQKQGLWEAVKPNVASFATSCEDTLNALLLGEADAVIGWDVYARQQPDKIEVVPLPAELATPRSVPAAVVKWSKQEQAARDFVAFCASPEGKEAFRKHSYTVELKSGK